MLFELLNDYKSLKPLKYFDIGEIRQKEKDLENLLAHHLLGMLFEGSRLLPFHQERNRQSEADEYAANVKIIADGLGLFIRNWIICHYTFSQ